MPWKLSQEKSKEDNTVTTIIAWHYYILNYIFCTIMALSYIPNHLNNAV